MKITKRGAVDRYLKKNPLTPPDVVAKELGCHPSTVYFARKRLGLSTNMKEQNALLFKALSAQKTLASNTVLVDESLAKEFARVKAKLDTATSMNIGLGTLAGVLALAVAFALTK